MSNSAHGTSHDEHEHFEESKDEASTFRDAWRKAPSGMKKTTGYGFLVAICFVAGLATYRYFAVDREESLRAAELKAGPRVRVVEAVKSKPERNLLMTGEAKPFASVTLYAKVSGYLKEVPVDKGDHVKKGDLLAIIESPEINRDYEGALADARNKQAIAKRLETLLKRQLVSDQEAEQGISDAAVARSKLGTAEVEKGYEVLRAPFDGVVVARFADPGALVQNAANSQTSALPVVSISQVDRLRVYVYVDQRDAASVSDGQPVTIRLTERPGLEIHAKVTRVSGELDEKTKMLLTEIDVDNSKGELVAGSFVDVAFTVPTPSYVQAPSETVIARKDGFSVAVVGEGDVVKFKEAKLADTDGVTVRFLSGIEAGERLIMNPSEAIVEGGHVRPIASEPTPTPTPTPPASLAPKAETAPKVDGSSKTELSPQPMKPESAAKPAKEG